MKTRSIRSLVLSLAFPFTLAACDGGPLPLQVEARDMIATAGGPTDKIELFVKTEPGAEITYGTTTENVGTSPNHSFFIPKSQLKLGPNTFTVTGVGGSSIGKKVGSANATLDVTAKMVLHVQGSSSTTADGTFTCIGSMCGAPSIAFTKAGSMPLAIMSDIAGTVTFNGASHPLDAGKAVTIETKLGSRLADTPLTPNDELSIPMTIEATGAKANDVLVLHGTGLTDFAVRTMRGVEQGPVVFDGEPASPATKPPTSLVVIGAPTAPLIVVGDAKKYADIDLVAIATPTEHHFPCPSGAGLLYVDTDVKVYARRTGAVVGTKSISADRTTCPPTPAAQTLKSVVREDDTKKVLATMLKK